jgi:hypothetical protein
LVYVAKQASVDQSTLITGKGKSVEFIRQVKKLGQVPVISDQASRSRVYHTHTHREREREREVIHRFHSLVPIQELPENGAAGRGWLVEEDEEGWAVGECSDRGQNTRTYSLGKRPGKDPKVSGPMALGLSLYL